MSRKRARTQSELSRREFFRRTACAGVGLSSVFSMIRDLRLINAAVAADSTTDYKAIVCLFLYGGNDANNLLIPMEDTATGYQAYSGIRKTLAIPLASLQSMQLNRLANPDPDFASDPHTYALHPQMTEIRDLFNQGKAAVLANVGTLTNPFSRTASPTPRSQYTAKSVSVPPQLFSHNDQVMQWHTSIPDAESRTGWGGRMADMLNDGYNPAATVSMSVSLSGSNTWEVGNIVHRYNCSTSGALTLDTSTNTSGVNMSTANQVLKNINALSLAPATPTAPQLNLYERSYADTTKTAIDSAAGVAAAIAASADPSASVQYWTVPFKFNYPRGSATFPGSSLMNQLKMVARMIHGHALTGHRRQIFFVAIGGYDLHDTQVTVTDATNNLTDPLSGSHAKLLSEISQAIHCFQKAMDQCRTEGKLTTGDAVTLFTASDFSRTCPVNGTWGSDHGWGSHQIVVGDHVVGKTVYGGFPNLTINGPDDTGIGRWIPKTSVDQYAATMAKWFGVSDTNLPFIFPNLPRFAAPTIGFMAP